MIRTGKKQIKPGDKVTVRSIDWYNRNKDRYGVIRNPNGHGFDFDKVNSKYCGCTVTVSCKDELVSHGGLRIKEDGLSCGTVGCLKNLKMNCQND